MTSVAGFHVAPSSSKSLHMVSGRNFALVRLNCTYPRRSLPPVRQRTRTKAALKDWRSSPGGGEDSSMGALDPFARRRLENAWTIRQQPVPVACETCCAQGVKECEWCSGSGYFVLGDKMLCEVPSRNTSCLICHGQGSVRCPDCLGTGFRARWLETVLEKKK